jgi:hypothetical protein
VNNTLAELGSAQFFPAQGPVPGGFDSPIRALAGLKGKSWGTSLQHGHLVIQLIGSHITTETGLCGTIDHRTTQFLFYAALLINHNFS